MSAQTAVAAVYNTHTEAETAVKELHKSGFDMKKLSIVGKNYHTEEDVVGYYNTGDRMKSWGKMDAFWGGLWDFIFGSAFFWIPGIGREREVNEDQFLIADLSRSMVVHHTSLALDDETKAVQRHRGAVTPRG